MNASAIVEFMKVAITGAKGLVGRSLLKKLDTVGLQLTLLDLPEHDVTDLQDLIAATKGHDALVHLAWNIKDDNFDTNNIDPANNLMTFNCYQAAVVNKIPRVIMASSNHAHKHELVDTDGKVRHTIHPQVPDSPYGAEKIFMEALGRYYATTYGLEVVCLRIGNVNEHDKPKPDMPDDKLRWLSHADLAQLITRALRTKTIPDSFQIIYGVSKQKHFDWNNGIGYEPQDG